MPQAVYIRVFGDTQMERQLVGIGERTLNAYPLFEDLGFKLSRIWRETFATSGARGGSTWAPLADSTVRQKAARGSATPDRPLEDTGALRESGLYGDDAHIMEVTPESLHWGSTIEYGVFHQPDPQGRRVFRLTDVDRIEIVKDFQRWIRYGTRSGIGML